MAVGQITGGKGRLISLERQALLLAMAGFSTFSIGDAVVKTMAGAWPSLAAAALRFAIATAVLGTILAMREGRAGFKVPRPGLQVMRGFGITMGTAAFFSAVYVMPLAESTSILFVSPMLTALAANVFLREPLRKSIWAASFFAFCGVLLVVRPNFAHFGWTALLPFAAATGLSILVLGNRMVAGLASSLAMQFFSAAIATVMLSAIAFAFDASGLKGTAIGWPEWSVVARCGLVAFTASCGHWLVYYATTRAGASVIAPMAYFQLLVAITAGWLLFDDWPDAISVAGAGMIVAAGLFLWWSGRSQALVETNVS